MSGGSAPWLRFNPQRRRLADDLSAGLVTLIESRGLRAGDQFDSVRALAERFRVAVPTLREALRRLEATGIIELRHGSGVYVGPNVNRLVLPNPVPSAPSAEQLINLLDARLQLEPPIAAKAAEVQEPAGLARVRECLGEAERCVAEHDEALWMVNLEFHRALAATAGNPVITEVVESLLLVHSLEQREILRIHGDERQDLDEHRAITHAVASGDVDGAGRLMSEHLRSVIDLVRSRLDDASAGSRDSNNAM